MDHDAHVPPPMYFTPPGGRTDTCGCPTGLARPPSSVVIVLLVRPSAARTPAPRAGILTLRRPPQMGHSCHPTVTSPCTAAAPAGSGRRRPRTSPADRLRGSRDPVPDGPPVPQWPRKTAGTADRQRPTRSSCEAPEPYSLDWGHRVNGPWTSLSHLPAGQFSCISAPNSPPLPWLV
jgi:hypothetical protein